MKQHLKRNLSLLTAILMLCCILPFNAMALPVTGSSMNGDTPNWKPIRAYSGSVEEKRLQSHDPRTYSLDNDPMSDICFNFETDPFAEGWICEDSDDDGYNWYWSECLGENIAPEGAYCMNSNSCLETEDYQIIPLTPDNWLISPVVTGGGSVAFKYASQSPNSAFAEEHIGVYASTDDGQTWSTELGYFTTSDSDHVQVGSINLEQFIGQDIRIAFRHYNSTDMFIASIDEVVVSAESLPEPPPTEVPTPEPTEDPIPTGEIWDGSVSEGFAGGMGTQDTPYLISTGAELAYLAQEVNAGSAFENVFFELTNDIWLNDTIDARNWETNPPENVWASIGKYIFDYGISQDISNPFGGNFNGNNYTIYGVYLNSSDESEGLFGYSFGTIKNLNVAASCILGNWVVGGVLGGNNGGSVTNCTFNGKLSGEYEVGGIVGENNRGGTIIDCISYGTICGDDDTGGIVGANGSEGAGYIKNCCNMGTVIGGSRATGGITGTNFRQQVIGAPPISSSEVTCSTNYGVVQGDTLVGGITGDNQRGTISFCHNCGSIASNATDGDSVGGIAGKSCDLITNCYNEGNIDSFISIGGIVGTNFQIGAYWNTSGGVVANSYNIGKVTGLANCGGIIGNNEQDGVIGVQENSYYLDTCCDGDNTLGTALTNEQMQVAENFIGFDFQNTWTMQGQADYPYPELDVRFKISFLDERTHEIISTGILVPAGTVIGESDFPEHPVHEGCEFIGWDYNNKPIYDNIEIRAKYSDQNAATLCGYVVVDPEGQMDPQGYHRVWSRFTEYAPEAIDVLAPMRETLAGAYAGGSIYGFLYDDYGTDTRFYIIDANTFDVTYPGYSTDLVVYAMAYNHSCGEMYALAQDPNDNSVAIYTVNLAMGTLNYVAPINADNRLIITLAIDREGNAYGISSEQNAALYSINLKNGICSFIGNTGLGVDFAQAMTFDHNTGNLFWAQFLDQYNNGLYIVNTETAEVTYCGKIGAGSEITALWSENDMPVAPIEVPMYTVTFYDSFDETDIPGGYDVAAGTVLDPAEFPEPPEHGAYEFTCWDYEGESIYADTVISARYSDPYQRGFYFEVNPAWEGWTLKDNDGDGYNWQWAYGMGSQFHVPEGNGCMTSQSFIPNIGAVSPDNWLISPKVPGGTEVCFMLSAQNTYCTNDSVGVYVSIDGGLTWSEELGNFIAGEDTHLERVDLSRFANQSVNIAFRHYNVSDEFAINIDAVVIMPDNEPVPGTEIGYYFEINPELEGWSWKDCDGDGYNWEWMHNPPDGWNVPEGVGMMKSHSLLNSQGALTPDNWLISPEVPGGGSVNFMYVAQDPANPSEVFGIYVTTDNGETWSDELGYFTTTKEIQTGIVDLGQYTEQNIQIAFRHYDVTDQFCLNLDAVVVTPPTEEPPTEEPPTEEPPTEEPPTAEPEPQEGDVIFDIRNPETEDGLYYAQPGETVAVNLTVTGEYAAHGANIWLDYDPEMLTVDHIEKGSVLTENAAAIGALVLLDHTTIPGSIRLGITAAVDPLTQEGVVYTVYFTVGEAVPMDTIIPLDLSIKEFVNMPIGEPATDIPTFAYDSGIVAGEEPVPPTEPPTEEPPTETPTEPPAPPITGFVSLAGAGVSAILAGAGVVLFRKKRTD